MLPSESGHSTNGQTAIREVVDRCSDCDTCRELMAGSCLFFPELFRLHDREKETGTPIRDRELQHLAALCTMCGLCPCPNIRADVIRGKSEQAIHEGLPFKTRLLADVQRLGKWCGMAPGLISRALDLPVVEGIGKKIAGVHPDRRLPTIPREHFFDWAKRRGLSQESTQTRKVAYFAGCSAGYLFPEVAKAAVNIMQANGIGVHIPPQQCCGMPALVEGDRQTTLTRVRYNLKSLLEKVTDGYTLVCSCPTCGYLLKTLLKDQACYAAAYQKAVNAGPDEILVPEGRSGNAGFTRLKKSIYQHVLRDNGYFSDIDPLGRIKLADNVLDLGQFLERLYHENRLKKGFVEINARMAYYAPCHQREQEMGRPYETLMGLIPGLEIEPVGSAMDCCGMGGHLGFKSDFSQAATLLAGPLLAKIERTKPKAVVTDCLSCRMQFQHLLPYPVYHPLELIAKAYEKAEHAKGGE